MVDEDNGTETLLPSWISFDEKTLNFRGKPSPLNIKLVKVGNTYQSVIHVRIKASDKISSKMAI